MKDYTDLTFELFNYCNGSCPGCMLNSRERQFFDLPSTVDEILLGLEHIAKYGKSIGLNYRVVFSFGDVPKLDWEKQKKIYKKVVELDMAFGLTLTCVDPLFNYQEIIDRILNISNDLVFDITIDPFRLTNNKLSEKYIENLRYATAKAPHLHLQTLLSSQMMKTYTPQDLVEIFEKVGDYPVFMGFSPTIENLISKDRYGYELSGAFSYAKSFYGVNERQIAFLQDELRRFTSEGEYKYFLKQAFHIDSSLNVYPVSYSIYGDIIQDKRNNVQPLGNLKACSLEDMLQEGTKKNIKVAALNIKNKIELDTSDFNCANCNFRQACEFQGIGLIRKTYKSFESRAGHCYGPIHLAGEFNGA